MLAVERKADLLLIDERRGLRLATEAGLGATGSSVGVAGNSRVSVAGRRRGPAPADEFHSHPAAVILPTPAHEDGGAVARLRSAVRLPS